MDAEGYRVAPFTYALVIGYNTRALSKEQRPMLMRSFSNRGGKVKWGWKPPVTNGSRAMIDTMGEERALAFARKLASINLQVQQGSSLLVQR